MLAGVKYSAGERFTKTVQNLKNRWHFFINTAISMNAYGFKEGSKMLTTTWKSMVKTWSVIC